MAPKRPPSSTSTSSSAPAKKGSRSSSRKSNDDNEIQSFSTSSSSTSSTSTKNKQLITKEEKPDSDSDSDDEDEAEKSAREAVEYQAFVEQKRKRNADKLEALGLLQAVADIHDSRNQNKSRKAEVKLLRKKEKPVTERRASGRLKGEVVDSEFFVVNDAGGRAITTSKTSITDSAGVVREVIKHYGARVNDGEDLPVDHWVDTVVGGEEERIEEKADITSTMDVLKMKVGKSKSAALSTSSFEKFWKRTSADDDNGSINVKVVKERIYSVAMASCTNKLITAAGDKVGNIGLWSTLSNPRDSDDDDSVVSFKPHSGAVSNLQFHSQSHNLLSVSYDGSVRTLDVERGVFLQSFACFDDSEKFKSNPGFAIDDGSSKFYLQYGCYDTSSPSSTSLFLSTSTGSVMHFDSRSNRLTFNVYASQKKVNTVDLNVDGFTLAAAGLDRSTTIFDIRKFSPAKSNANSKKIEKPIVTFTSSKSVNSSFFSASGKHLLSTCMNDSLTVHSESQWSSASTKAFKPTVSIPHNNQTGRWLTTFHAAWHPSQDIFLAGSMAQPRMMQLFDVNGVELRKQGSKGGVTGGNLTAVVSRVAFHDTLECVIGGNSSGRVTMLR